MSAVYDSRPVVKPWMIHEIHINGWIIEVQNTYVQEKFYENHDLPFWKFLWSREKRYAKLLAKAQRYTKREDARILEVQKQFDARKSVINSQK